MINRKAYFIFHIFIPQIFNLENLKLRIAIYVGNGPSPLTISHLKSALMLHFQNAVITDTYGVDLRNNSLNALYDLIAMPGGPSSKMSDEIGETGLLNIRNFVENGGHYIGFCGGAYLASKRSIFKTTQHDLDKTRNLALFNGTKMGPIDAGLGYITLMHNHTELPVYLYGGGYFVDASKHNHVDILAKFSDGEAAVILCHFGKGKALLSSPHFEYDPYHLRGDSYVNDQHITTLMEVNIQRLSFMQYALEKLTKPLTIQRSK